MTKWGLFVMYRSLVCKMSRTVTRAGLFKRKKHRPRPLLGILTAQSVISNVNPLHAHCNIITANLPKQNQGRVYSQAGARFVSADCNKEKARIMNHLSGSVPLNRERLQQHKRKTSVRKGRHVRWASVAALEFFFSFFAEIT